ncbi:hypothetical protein [Pantoea sp. WMus005]|uniref:hypothetical protein n=1 Tax=Pantoea sp. WMus005 TaxID=2750734 RepID=UPI0015D0B16F|nr:hypothetical protein [Pantoea sp. WMus005]NYS31330.1 hypothetical protein [Pantoea sp. WMus005]
MTAKKEVKNPGDTPVEKEKKVKTCFVIMPIADHPDYEKDHFNRVYEYLIKPACINAGYQPYRADDSKASHMIMFDILKKIMDCDMAICDLSSKNANVFYELGLRQAFNKKTILITDGRDKAPFDISGFRYVPYTPSLRVDSVEREISSISEMLIETEAAPDDDVNSIVKLLKIKPAHVEPVELNSSESMLFNLITKLQDKIDALAPPKTSRFVSNRKVAGTEGYTITSSPSYIPLPPVSIGEILNNNTEQLMVETFYFQGEKLGILESYNKEFFTFIDPLTNFRKNIPITNDTMKNIYAIPSY